MRGRHGMAVAVRAPDDRVVVRFEPLAGWLTRSRLARVPFARGVVVLADTLRLGMRALFFSVEVASGEVDEATPASSYVEPSDATLWSSVLFSTALAVGVFFLAPLGVTLLFDPFIASPLLANLLEGALRLGLLVGYLLLLGRRLEVQRLFRYHGAEHKTVNAFEAGAALTPASVRRFGLTHPRCGTGFLLVVVLVATVVFALLGRPDLPLRVVSRLALLPVIVAIAFEYVRLTADFYHLGLVRLLAAPSLALQRLSTREPDDAMLDVAITALQRVLAGEAALVGPAAGLEPAGERAPGGVALARGDG